MIHERDVKAWSSTIAVAGVIGVLLPLVLGWQHLPEPMATHWGISGAPDGRMPKLLAATLFVSCVILPACFAWRRREARSPGPSPARNVPRGLATLAFTSAVMVAVSFSTVWLNWDSADWTRARHFSVPLLLLLLALPLAVGAAVFLAARRVWPAVARGSGPPPAALPLDATERAYWSGTASNAGVAALGLVLLIQGGVVGLIIPSRLGGYRVGFIVVYGLLMVALELLSMIRVTVDERALIIRYGHLGWLRQRVPLERVLAAEACDLEALEHGGWGYRGNVRWLGRAAVVVRSGSALRLELRDSKQLIISVDDARTAAELINGFVRRRGASPEGGEAPTQRGPRGVAGAL